MAMETATKGTRITVDLGSRDLYKRLRVAAAEQDMNLREVVVEAVEYWLDHHENIEDELAARVAERRKAEDTGMYVPHEQALASRHESQS